jgi:hypothetical protein
MFGREMNEFAISSQTPADYEAKVLKRNIQIKNLIENTRPQALTNIQKTAKTSNYCSEQSSQCKRRKSSSRYKCNGQIIKICTKEISTKILWSL